MKGQQIRELSDEELQQKEEELIEQLFKLRFQQAIGQTENPQKLKLIRKDVARVKTIIRERQLTGQTISKSVEEEKEEKQKKEEKKKEEKKKKKRITKKKEEKLKKKEEKEKSKKKSKKKEKSSEKEK
jgi:large subunit ribosomal protein L29